MHSINMRHDYGTLLIQDIFNNVKININATEMKLKRNIDWIHSSYPPYENKMQ